MSRARYRIAFAGTTIATPLPLALTCALWGITAFAAPALPAGGVVTAGSGSIGRSGTTLTVDQSSQALSTSWLSFDIAAGHSVVFNQPNSASVALNRVVGANASSIYGSLSANGKVFLINPNGVLFARGAQVSAGGFIASTLNLSDEDFAAGHYRFTGGAGKGSVTNEGSIRAGSVALIAPKVVNGGTIQTPGGSTTLAAGDRVTVHLIGGLITAEVDASVLNAEVRNHGHLSADGGRVSLLAGRADAVVDSLINTDGVVQASGIRNENGKIYLDGGAGGTVYVSGALDASSAQPGAHGGDVVLLGKNIGLMRGAVVDVSGASGGGAVRVGGDWQGGGMLAHADAVVMQTGARIDASATRLGDGGKVVLWSDGYTGFYGNIVARGGPLGGAGGQVETSSHRNLQAFGRVDATAPRGTAGQWLLDPTNVTIVAGSVDSNETNSGGVWTPSTNSAQIGVANINSDLNAGTSVTINTASDGTAAGHITQNSGATISKTAGGNATLTMNAAGAITLNDSITSSAGTLDVTLSSAGNTTQVSGRSINTNGGTLTVNAGSVSLAGAYTATGGMALNLATGAGSSLSGPVTGAGSLAVTGGSLRISGTKTFTGAFTAANSTVFLDTPTNNVSSATFTNATFNLDPGRAYRFGSSLTLNNTALRVACPTCGHTFTSISSPVTMIGTNSITINANQYQQGLTLLGGFEGSGNVTLRAASSYRSLLEVTGSMAGYSGTINASAPTGQPYWVQINSVDGWGTGTLNVTGGNVSVNYNYNTDNALPYYPVTSAVNQPTARLNVSGGTFTIGADMTIGALSGSAAGTINLLSNTATRSTLTTGLLDGAGDVFAGVLTGPGHLAKVGTGTQVLTGNNNYTGSTLVSAGALQVGNGGDTGTLGTGVVTTNADLVFNRSDTVNLSALTANPAGIGGTGNVTALVGGGFAVDRPVTLTGASSTILLQAGHNLPAGAAAGGDVTLDSPISTSAGGTVTIFSGHADTAALDAQVSGATGATRYKTYNASASATGGAVGGTRNYLYRERPVLAVSGLTASKTYDGLVNATAALDASVASVSGTIEGDSASYANVMGANATFGTAHAGSNLALNASFVGATATGVAGGANWSVSGYSVADYSASTGTITPRPVTTSINAVGKVFDGATTTTSTLAAPTGLVGNDSATGVSGLALAFDNPDVGTRNVVASGTGSLSGFVGVASGNGSSVGAGNEVAGFASDYTVVTPASASAVIGQALLTITANNDAKIVTQSDSAGYNGASYSGFVHGQTAADLSGTLTITRSNAGIETAGDYAGALVPSGQTSGNYAINYVNGDYRIVPAQQLLVRIQNVDTTYGATPGYVVTSARYLDASGTTIRTLTPTAQNGSTYTYSDGVGGSVTFTVTPTAAVNSSGGHLVAGNYVLSGIDQGITGSNFVGLNFVGNQTVGPRTLTPVAGGASKVYDGTTAMTNLTLGLSGALPGDTLSIGGTGTFGAKGVGDNLGYTLSNLALSGADAANYQLAAGTWSGSDGRITPRAMTVTGIAANDKVYDGTTTAVLTTAGYALSGMVSGDAVDLSATNAVARFDSRDVGSDKTVSATGLALSGTDAGNYVLAQPVDLTASITPRSLVVTAVSNTKVYDGTTAAGGVPTVSGSLAMGDQFMLLNETYTSSNIGTGLTLVPAAVIDDGNGGANYALSFVPRDTGEIRSALNLSGIARTEPALDCDHMSADASRSIERRISVNSLLHGDCTGSERRIAPAIQVISSGIRLPHRLPER